MWDFFCTFAVAFVLAFGKTIALAAALRHRGSVCLRSPKNNLHKVQVLFRVPCGTGVYGGGVIA